MQMSAHIGNQPTRGLKRTRSGPGSGSADSYDPLAISPSAAALQVGAHPSPKRMRCARHCPTCVCLPVPSQRDETCRPFLAGSSTMTAQELLQCADEQALVLGPSPQTSSLTKSACRAVTDRDISNGDRAPELEQIAVKAMRAYRQ